MLSPLLPRTGISLLTIVIWCLALGGCGEPTAVEPSPPVDAAPDGADMPIDMAVADQAMDAEPMAVDMAPPCPIGGERCPCTPGGACDPGLVCADDICVIDECPPGTPSCRCAAGELCAAGHVCADGTCSPADPPCPRGSEGCPCAAGVCGVTAEGRPLACVDDQCAVLDCPPGETGCACVAGECLDPDSTCEAEICAPIECRAGDRGCACAAGACNDPADVCADDLCQIDACPPGQSGCRCDAGACADPRDVCLDGLCADDPCPPGREGCLCPAGGCDAGLACQDGICADATGDLGAACFPNATCLPGLTCRDATCVPCIAGTEACRCDDAGACSGALVCDDGLCVERGAVAIPNAPRCYTTCRDPIVANDGRFVPCPADGLMAGCHRVGRVCRAGSCLLPDEEPPVCDVPADCPDFQTCLEGQCVSNCSGNDECPSGLCHRKVCREPCDINAADCPFGTACEAIDGVTGACMPTLEPGEPAAELPGTLTVGPAALMLSSSADTDRFTVHNNADQPVEITVRKRSQRVTDAQGNIDERAQPDPDIACDLQRTCPLTWLTLGLEDAGQPVPAFTIRVPARGTVEIEVGNAAGSPGVRWQGALDITAPGYNRATVDLQYTQTPDGRWTGTMFYFGQFGAEGLDAWRALDHAAGLDEQARTGTRDDTRILSQVRNAFVQTWGGFRRRRISWDEFNAVLQSTRTESWAQAPVRDACFAETGRRAAGCYLYSASRSGVRRYSENTSSTPIPSGLVDLPIAMNLRAEPGDAAVLTGRIASDATLHYAGDPAVRIPLDAPIDQCSRDGIGACLTFFDAAATRDGPMARINVGGQMALGDRAGCPVGYEIVETPWLVDGFVRDTSEDGAVGLVRRTCRSTQLPFGDPDLAVRNVQLAGSNPIPDGRARRRSLHIVDGAFINQQQLFLIFEERFESFLGESDQRGFSAYGYMLLTREPDTEIETTDANDNDIPDMFEGADPPDMPAAEPVDVLQVTCPDAIADRVPGFDALPGSAERVLSVLLDGVDRTPDGPDCLHEDGAHPCLPDAERVHAWCEDLDVFDDGGAGLPCPDGSAVVYFTVDAETSDLIADHVCQAEGGCGGQLDEWRTAGLASNRNVPWTCHPNTPDCADNRVDLLAGRVFFGPDEATAVFAPLHAEIAQAFRYKVRFRSREGTNLGFAPVECVPGSDREPYCYDPAAIEMLRARVDCLLALWNDDAAYAALTDTGRATLNDTLRENFSVGPVPRQANLPRADLRDGFERLYAELLVMQGDEALTKAFGSRFDLDGGGGNAFLGSRFEEGGIDLAGVAGGEMRALYQAHQSYSEALDRFYTLAPTIWAAVEQGRDARNFVTPDMVMEYLERLVRAATQKTRAASAIAERYQGFDRVDLARGVLERAFTAAYLESIVLARMMLGVVDGVPAEARPQIERFVNDAQARYQAAMLDMRRVHGSLRSNVNAFGFAPDYIPFFTIDVRETNAFERALALAQQRARFAREREDLAINSDRSFDTDAAEFQAELVRNRNTYEAQLLQICGSFEVEDANGQVVEVLPAVKRYAHRHPQYKFLNDPCGFAGNGDIHGAFVQVETAAIDLRRILQQMQNVRAEIDIELTRIAKQCGQCDPDVLCQCTPGAACNCAERCSSESLLQIATARVTDRGEGRRTLEADIRENQFQIARNQARLQAAEQFSFAANCSTSCATSFGAAAVFAGLTLAVDKQVANRERTIHAKELELIERESEDAVWELERECLNAEIDSGARVDTIALRLQELELEALRASYQIDLERARVDRLFHQSRRLQLEQAEAEQLAIEVAAAKNDPNIRIYRNNAVINADVAFKAAMRDAYRATLVFEYYTSQSYDRRGDLFLTRMVARGQPNLEDYLNRLENAFLEFEQEFNLPQQRVLVLSLRDDILRIPRADVDGRELTPRARIQRMRDLLAEPSMLDRNGYLSIPFQTRLEDVSPATRNHKLLSIEAELNLSEGGDSVARLYVVQGGTSALRSVDDETLFFRLPPLTAVVNPYFSGAKGVFAPEVYTNLRLRDRPLVSTDWRLVINQRDEVANQDLNLQSLNDIRLFLYYTDFTEFGR